MVHNPNVLTPTPEYAFVQDLLERRDTGWQVSVEKVIYPHYRREFVRLQQGMHLFCADGRSKQNGPCLIGGVLNIMALKTGGDWDGFRDAIALLYQLGLNPGFHGEDRKDGYRHGDPSDGQFACGLRGLWSQGLLQGVQPYSLTESDLFGMMSFCGYEDVHGTHQEKMVRLNLIPGYVLTPDGNFRTELAVAKNLGIPLDREIDLSAQAVEKLRTPRVARIYTL